MWSVRTFPAVGSLVGLRSIPGPPPTNLEAWVTERAESPDPPVAFVVPEVCLDDITREKPDGVAEAACVDALAALASTRTSEAEACWPLAPTATGLHARPTDEEVLSITPANCSGLPGGAVFHTVVLGDAPPPIFGPFLVAFLATQCCGAELWVWTTTPLTAAAALAAHAIPAQHAHRLRVLPFEAAAHWRAINGEAAFAGVLAGGASGEERLIRGYFDVVDAANQVRDRGVVRRGVGGSTLCILDHVGAAG